MKKLLASLFCALLITSQSAIAASAATRGSSRAASALKRFDTATIEKAQAKKASDIKKKRETAKKAHGKSSSSKASASYMPKQASSASSKISGPLPVDLEVTLSIASFLAPTETNLEVLKKNADYYNDASHKDYYNQLRSLLFTIQQNAAKLGVYQKFSESRGLTSEERKDVDRLKSEINKGIGEANAYFN